VSDRTAIELSGRERNRARGTPSASLRGGGPIWGAILVGLAIFGLLWFLNIRYRHVYQPDDNDVTALVDGLLLLPDAQWQDWFTRGHTHFFDTYPEWPWGLTPFARPAFQSLIYLAHFLFGRYWASYLTINYLALAAIAAVAFLIARKTLRLGTGSAVLAAALVAVSPAVLGFSFWRLGFASEPLASAFVGCAFLALISRRDFLCVFLLSVALLTKETAVWAPFAAALTVVLRPNNGNSFRRRLLGAAAMLLPLMFWLGLRFSFYGGVSGGYATGSYSPLVDFLSLVGWKVTHLHRLFVGQDRFVTEGNWAVADWAVMIGTHVVVWLLLFVWVLGALGAATKCLGPAIRERRLPTADAPLLVALWATMGFAFHLAHTLDSGRYAASAAMFVWPAVVSEAMGRRQVALRLGLAVCLVLSLARTWPLVARFNPPSALNEFFADVETMNTALRQVPAGIRQVYVVPEGSVATASPDHLQAFLDVPFEIVRVIDVHSACKKGEQDVFFDHSSADGVVRLSVAVPECAFLFFDMAGTGSTALIDGRIQRSGSIDYELPEAHLIDYQGPLKPALRPGRRMIAHIRPSGPARFIIEHGGPGGGLTWFDTPG
jgi:hypothetical protein